MGGREFIGQLIVWLLSWDLFYISVAAVGVIVIAGLIRFVITLKEDMYE